MEDGPASISRIARGRRPVSALYVFTSEWQRLMGIGSPAAHRSVKQYLANVREEQLKARSVPPQAEPFLVGDDIRVHSCVDSRVSK